MRPDMKRSTLIALIVGLSLVLCCACVAGAGGIAYFLSTSTGNSGDSGFGNSADERPAPPPQPTTPPDATLPPQPNAPVAPVAPDAPTATAADPSQPSANGDVLQDNLNTIANATLPREDLADLAVRFKGVPPEKTTVTCTEQRSFSVGDTRTFIMSNQDDNSQFEITTRLEHATDHVYMWVEIEPKKVRLNLPRLRSAAEDFEKDIYPINRAFFGSEAQPGVDCDPHVHVVHVDGVGSSVGGYFSSPDSFPKAVRADSNEGQVFVMHAAPGYNGSDPGGDSYMSTMAHEFQHMISFNNNHAPDLWLEEGAAQFAERLNGYGAKIGTVFSFAAQPEIQLNTWEESSAGDNSPHYGAGYLFWSYLYDRFGEEMTKKLAASPERSEQAFMRLLADNSIVNPDTGRAFSFEELFSDFVVANYMSKTKIEEAGNRYNYASISVPPMAERANYSNSDYPLDVTDTIAQFGTHYIELRGDKKVSLSFVGANTVNLLPIESKSDGYYWSNRSDVSNSRMTRAFDLTRVQKATLKFKTWYRLERDWDYAFASISADNGATWKTLKTQTCTTSNPQGANLGCSWTGSSGANDKESPPVWIDEQADLSEYAGKKVMLRFEMITDAAVNREGLAIDDIQIPELNFTDNADAGVDWQMEGWARVTNTLPQNWSVQMIVTKRDGARELRRVTVASNGSASAEIDFAGEGGIRSVILAISPTTQVTTEVASYRLKIQ